jgi:hypothetical protein
MVICSYSLLLKSIGLQMSMVQMQNLSEPRGNLVFMLLLVPHIHDAGGDPLTAVSSGANTKNPVKNIYVPS